MEYSSTETTDILKQDSFRVEILSLPSVVLFTQELDLPGVILGEAIRVNPNIDYALPGDKIDFENFTLTFMVDEKLENYLEVMKWMFGLGFPRSTKEFKNLKEGNSYNEMSDIKIQLLTNKMNYYSEITFVNAFPISLSAIQLSYTDEGPVHPKAVVEFQYHYYYYGSKDNDFLNVFFA